MESVEGTCDSWWMLWQLTDRPWYRATVGTEEESSPVALVMATSTA